VRLVRSSLLLALLGVAASCGGDESNRAALRVASEDGRLALEIPREALDGVDVDRDEIEIRSVPVGTPSSADVEAFDAAYELLPDGLELAAPARLELKLEPDAIGAEALHISAAEDGTPDLEYLELEAKKGEPGALVAEIEHFSEVPIVMFTPGEFELTRLEPEEDSVSVLVGKTVEVGYRPSRKLATTEYTWPLDDRKTAEFRYRVTVEPRYERPWKATAFVRAGAPLTPGSRSVEGGSAGGQFFDLPGTSFTCEKEGSRRVTAELELVENTGRATVEQLARGGKPTGQTEVFDVTRPVALVSPFDPLLAAGPRAKALDVRCAAEPELAQYLTGVQLPGTKFTVSPLPIEYENGDGCGAAPRYTVAQKLTVRGFRLDLTQLGHGGALDAFTGEVDPATGDFSLESNPDAGYDARYDGHLEPDGSAEGRYEFTYPEGTPQNGCTVVYDFRWERFTADLVKGLKGN
jgi:hypothetical protein